MATNKATGKATKDSKGNELYLLVSETREHGYFHLHARVTTQRYEGNEWVPYGCDDDYSDGLLWSGLRVSCQGDDQTQRAAAGDKAVYGYDVEYHDVYRVDLRKAHRMAKTLAKIEKGLYQLQEARGYVRSYGEYLGRVAEVLGCAGIGLERSKRSESITGQRWRWQSVGAGVNEANHRIWLWQQEAVERDGPQQLQATGGAA